MAYQNVGTPRFYVCTLQWLKAQGLLSIANTSFEDVDLQELIGINPTDVKKLTHHPDAENEYGTNDVIRYNTTFPLGNIMPNDNNFAMVLGHNFGSAKSSFWVAEGTGDYSNSATTPFLNIEGSASTSTIDYDGFSIVTGNNAANMTETVIQFRFDYQGGANVYNDLSLKIGSLLYGNYYDMPHSPDLKLKMSIEMDGVKNIKTKGGASLTGINYNKPPDWGDGGAWQLGLGDISNLNLNNEILLELYQEYWDEFPVMGETETNEEWFGAYQAEVYLGWLEEEISPDVWMGAYSHLVYFTSYAGLDLVFTDNLRSGRRSWDLSFSFLSDTDVFPVNASSAHGVYGTTEGYADEDTNDAGTSFNTNILTGENFFSQVWNRTMGGHLPFIFQPDGGGGVAGAGNFNPDQFAICRFDMKSLQISQTLPNVYSVKLKIRESW